MARGKQQARENARPVWAFSRLLSIRKEVMLHWEREARARVDGARHLHGPVLTQELSMLFDDIAMALASNEPMPNRIRAGANEFPASHGVARARRGAFGPEQLIHEYQIFRESIAAVAEDRVDIDSRQWEQIDQAVFEAARQSLRAFANVQEQARGKVAAALSHDMRTPLAVISNGAQLISITQSLESAQKSAAQIGANAARLNAMIGELLDALTLQGGAKLALELTCFNALALVEEARDQYAQGCAWDVEIEEGCAPVIGYWCKDALRRAMENLINNAMKYGDGGPIRLAARESSGRLTLSVRNTGNPVPQDQKELIFEYLRRDQNVSSAPGWGIGLHFVKAVALAHGGDVSVESSKEEGTTFFLRLPLDCRPYADSQNRSHARNI